MTRCLFLLTLVASLLALWNVPLGFAQDKKTEKEIRELAEKANQALKNKDVDGLMKIADVPWCFDIQKVIKMRDQLRTEYTNLFFNSPDYSVHKAKSFKIIKIHKFEEIRKLLPEDKRKLIDPVMTVNDWCVWIQTEGLLDGGYVLMIGIRNGKLKLVGTAS